MLTALILAGFFAFSVGSQARHQVELQSTYLGDGWFQYRVHTLDDPFFLFFDLPFLFVAFPGYVQYGPDPAGWTSIGPEGQEAVIGWQAHLSRHVRPYARVFLARSDKRHFKRRQDAFINMSLATVGAYHGSDISGNFGGFAYLNALVPCDPQEADGSMTNLLERLAFLPMPDPQIRSLIRAGGEVRGITFQYDEPSTMRLEASRDFRHWTNIAYIYGNTNTTTWTSDVALNQFGDFFRLRLIAEGHASPLPPLTESSAQTGESLSIFRFSDLKIFRSENLKIQGQASVLSCRPRGQGLEVRVIAAPGTRHAIKLLSKSGQTLQTRVIEGTGSVVALIFDAPPANPVLVTATLITDY